MLGRGEAGKLLLLVAAGVLYSCGQVREEVVGGQGNKSEGTAGGHFVEP